MCVFACVFKKQKQEKHCVSVHYIVQVCVCLSPVWLNVCNMCVYMSAYMYTCLGVFVCVMPQGCHQRGS